ncbi:MAG TPA: YhjD/YihY/BrkB family envelope integrity protein, partial [Lacipirellulaceae bacterium]|nr:YhjD/YihY/BrkB family envelope integrity protein [Lacipirellulaceae bacterium]
MHYVNWAQGLPRVLLRRLYAAMQGFNEHDGLSMAAATAYYFALSLFPLMLILVAGLGIVLRTTAAGQDARTKVLQFIEQQASPELADQIGRALEVVSDRAAATGPIGFLVLLVTAILIFTQIDYSFQRIWGVTGKSHHGRLDWLWRLVSRRLRAVVMLLAAGAFVFLGTVASLVWSTAQAHLAKAFEILPDDGWALSLAMNVGLNFVAFAL